jgi:hypothetical protein
VNSNANNTSTENYGNAPFTARTPWNKWSSIYNPPSDMNDSAYITSGVTYQVWAQQFDASRLQANIDGSSSCWPFEISRIFQLDNIAVMASTGAFSDNIGSVPFVYRIPAYDASGNLLVSESVLRSRGRTKMVVLQNGALSNSSNLFAVEMF